MDGDDLTAIHRIGEMRRLRDREAQAMRPSVVRRYSGNPDALKLRLKLMRDPTLATQLDLDHQALEKRRKVMAQCGSAWRDVVEKHVDFPVRLVAVRRSVLLVVVPNSAANFKLVRLLRAGTESAFVRACRASISKVRVVVGQLPDLFINQPMRTRTSDEAEEELQLNLDEGRMSPEQAEKLRAEWDRLQRQAEEQEGPLAQQLVDLA